MVQIISDSTCDLTRERMAELGVVCVPLTVHFGDKTYFDGVDLNAEDFYHNLRTNDEIPTTAQPTPASFEDAFRAALDKGDDVLCIVISNELSGTFQSANIAKNALESDKVWIVDSRNACVAVGLFVEIAAKRAKEGRSAQEIYDELQGLTDRLRILAAVETLQYLKKGGRLSGTAAVIGTMLNLHPILAIKDGVVLNVGKAKGKKKMYALMKELMLADGIDEAYPVVFGHGASKENWENLREALGDTVDISQALYSEIGPVIGTYTGPGVVAIGFIAKK